MKTRVRLRQGVARRHHLRKALVRARHFGLRESDALVVSFPKSGTTWLRFMVAQILTGTEADFDTVDKIIPVAWRRVGAPELLKSRGRVFNTHEPYTSSVFDSSLRVLYLLRDGRDVAISLFHYARIRGLWEGSLSDFVEEFLAGAVGAYGRWDDHVASWVASANARRGFLHVVKYERLLEDPVGELASAIDFLGFPCDHVRIEAAVSANHAAVMRRKETSSQHLGKHKNASRASFVRRAEAGGWREELPEDLGRRLTAAFGPTLRSHGYMP